MKLDSFKELLIKKAEDNDSLKLLIKYMRDDFLVDHVVESLEKMAQFYSKKNPNHALLHFGEHMDPGTEPEMIHDALSHHASHYKSALASGNKQLADQHMKKIFEIQHMADKLTRDGLNDHSKGKLKIEAVDPKPWERAKYAEQNEGGKFKTDTKGWSRHGSDYSFLRDAPHESYKKEIKSHGHNKAYPLEEMKVNNKHIHIEDVDGKGKFVPHPFDEHPVMSHYNRSPKEHTAEHQQKYMDSHDQYSNEGINKYFDMTDARDPKAHAARGSVKADRIHDDIPGLSIEDAPAGTPAVAAAPVEASPTPAPAADAGPSLADIQAKLAAIRGKK
jgi:hypothetical protein